MKTLLKNGHIFTEKGFEKRDVFVVDDPFLIFLHMMKASTVILSF